MSCGICYLMRWDAMWFDEWVTTGSSYDFSCSLLCAWWFACLFACLRVCLRSQHNLVAAAAGCHLDFCLLAGWLAASVLLQYCSLAACSTCNLQPQTSRIIQQQQHNISQPASQSANSKLTILLLLLLGNKFYIPIGPIGKIHQHEQQQQQRTHYYFRASGWCGIITLVIIVAGGNNNNNNNNIGPQFSNSSIPLKFSILCRIARSLRRTSYPADLYYSS